MRKDEQQEEKREKPPRVKKEKVLRGERPKRSKPTGGHRGSIGDFFRSRIVIGFICIIVALLIAFVGFPIVQGVVSKRVPVVTAAENISRGTLITPQLLKASEIGAIDRPSSAAVSIDQVVGAYASMDLLAGDMVTSGKLSRERPLSNPYLYELPEGKLAISVSVKGLAEGLTGKLKEGDIVSVYAVFNKSDAEENYFATQPPELRYVRVLAVSNSLGDDIDVDARYDTEEERTRLPETITLLTGDLQAAALAGLDSNATIHVGLAARADSPGLCDALLAAQEEYIAELEEALRESAGEEDTGGDPAETSPDATEAPDPEEGGVAREQGGEASNG